MSVLASYRAAWVPVVVIVLVMAAAGCDSRQIPGTPSQTPPPPPPPPSPPRILGQVFEITAGGRVPAPDIPLTVTVITGNCPARICSSHVLRFRDITSDAGGHYTFASLPADATRAFVSPRTSGYHQTCGAATVLAGDTRLDLEITSSSNPQPSMSPTPLLVTGQVFERTSSGRVGIGHALVGLEYLFPDLPFFQVEADTEGRYVLCGVPTNQRVALWAWADGYEDIYVWHTFTTSTAQDVELIRESR